MNRINNRWLIGAGLTYLFLLFSIPNPKFLPVFLEYKRQFTLFFENSSNVLATLSAIAAMGSFFATYLSFRVANSSRKIAKSALNYQHKESINQSINVIVSTLVEIKTITASVGSREHSVKHYNLSLKRTDWIFAAQEVQGIIEDIIELSKSETDRERLMERYGRILSAKLCPMNATEKVGLFTSSKPGDTYLDIMFTKQRKTIRDEDLFAVYLFTERYEPYREGTGQYPSPNICCYFNETTNFELS